MPGSLLSMKRSPRADGLAGPRSMDLGFVFDRENPDALLFPDVRNTYIPRQTAPIYSPSVSAPRVGCVCVYTRIFFLLFHLVKINRGDWIAHTRYT